MKNKFIKVALFTTMLATIAGCGPTTSQVPSVSEEASTEPVSELTKEEKQAVLLEVANFVPLVTENGTGTVLYRDEVSDLVDGRDLTLRTKATREEGVVTIAWSYKVGVDGAGRDLGTFAFTDIDGETTSARPGYPEYELQISAGGDDISVIPPTSVARLYADLTLEGETLRVYFDMYLQPQMRVDWVKLDVIRDTPLKTIVGARGYITTMYADNNALTVQDGEYALNFFKIQEFAAMGLKVGDYIEAVGEFGGYNGVSQLSWIKRLNIADPVENGAALPVVHDITPADFKEFFDATDPAAQFMTKLYELDSARVKVDTPLKILRAIDANGVEIALSALPTTGKHADIILGATVGTTDIEIKLSLNYHIGPTVQQGLKDKLIAAGIGGHITYDGILSWYNEPILNPMTIADVTVVA